MAIGIPKQTEAFSKKAQEATYLVTELISLKRKSQTVDENVIRAIYKVTVSKMLQQDTVWRTGKVPRSDSTGGPL